MGFSELWRAFEANEITHSAAHYLLAISSLTADSGPPLAADVARRLHVSRAAASTQLRSLRDHGWVAPDSGRRLHLTPEGRHLVARIAGHRATLKAFLHEFLGLDSLDAEIEACKIEHLLSPAACAALLRIVRLHREGHPSATGLSRTLRSNPPSCPGDHHCDLCTDLCLLGPGSGIS